MADEVAQVVMTIRQAVQVVRGVVSLEPSVLPKVTSFVCLPVAQDRMAVVV
jgi:hypothetical protein